MASATGDGLRIVSDEVLLASAAGNLLANAVKFTRDRGHVDIRDHTAPDGSLVIEVEDECGRLPPGAAERIFEPFVQGCPDRRGVGLGLSVTRDAVAALGGEIGVRDMPGKGCVFALKLPATRVTHAE